jgi:hypothetical protein
MNTPQTESASAPPYHLICLDPSRAYSTIHGDRHPDDPHYRAAYQQNGLFFDVNQKLVPPDGKTAPYQGMNMEGKLVTYEPLYTAKMRELVEHRLRRLSKSSMSLPEAEETPIDPNEQPPETDLVNLGQWMRGELNWPTNAVYEKIRRDYSANHTNVPDAVTFLFKQGIVPMDKVAPKFLQYLEKVEA